MIPARCPQLRTRAPWARRSVSRASWARAGLFGSSGRRGLRTHRARASSTSRLPRSPCPGSQHHVVVSLCGARGPSGRCAVAGSVTTVTWRSSGPAMCELGPTGHGSPSTAACTVPCGTAATSCRSPSWLLGPLMLRSRSYSSSQQLYPTGHGPPRTVISSARDVRGAPWDRCDALSLAKLAPRALDAPEQLLLFQSAAWPDWPRLAKYLDLLSMRRSAVAHHVTRHSCPEPEALNVSGPPADASCLPPPHSQPSENVASLLSGHRPLASRPTRSRNFPATVR